MEEISLNGENYVKASSIARELGYTSDYVGQLCRSNQVEAKLVGRSWFVKEDSLRSHKEGRYRSTAQKSRLEVKRAVNLLQNEKGSPNYLKRLNVSPNYEADASPLLPSLKNRLEAEVAKKTKPFRLEVSRKATPARGLRSASAEVSQNETHTGGSSGNRVAVISARFNRLDGDRSEININDFRSPSRFTGIKFKLTLGALLLVAACSLLSVNFVLESRIFATEISSRETFDLNVSHFKILLIEAIK